MTKVFAFRVPNYARKNILNFPNDMDATSSDSVKSFWTSRGSESVHISSMIADIKYSRFRKNYKLLKVSPKNNYLVQIFKFAARSPIDFG